MALFRRNLLLTSLLNFKKRYETLCKGKDSHKVKHRKLTNDFLKYEQHQETFVEYSSFSKTDTNATFMQIKENNMELGLFY